jgi:hypothetical protein
MATTKTPTPASVAADAAAAVLEARQVLEQWRTRLTDAQAELSQADAVSGDELLDDPERAAGWPAHLRELRDQVEVTGRSVAAQEQRVRAAEHQGLAAAAVVLEVDEVVPARKALETHVKRTRELLNALEEHDGPYVPQIDLARAQRSSSQIIDAGGAVPARLPNSHRLQVRLARAEVRHGVLAALAKGEDPNGLVVGRPYASEISEADCYPDVVGPAGLVPAPVYAGRAAAARARVVELERLPQELEAEIARAEEEVGQGMRTPENARTVVAWNRARLEDIPDELAAARAQLDALTRAG